MHLSTKEHPWGKPFTLKRYIHPPFAENVVTMWSSSMILISEIREGRNSQVSLAGRRDQSTMPSSAVIFTFNGEFMPFKEVKYKTRKDGYPIHTLIKSYDGIKFTQETFCDTKRVPTAYIKIKLENISKVEKRFTFGLMVRTGPELSLIGGDDPDGYNIHESKKGEWLSMPKFKKTKGKLSDGLYTLRFSSQTFDDEKFENDLSVDILLNPKEKKTFYFTFTRNKGKTRRYCKAKNETEKFWNKELSKAQNIPVACELPFFYNVLAQSLQMFSYPYKQDYVLCRQGGLQRYIWPTEAVFLIKALSEIGGYDEYIDKTLNTYFNVMQIKEGENAGQITNFGVAWGSVPGACIETYAHIAKTNESIYEKYYDKVVLAFRWIEKMRQYSKTIDGAVGGLFPPWQSSDYGDSSSQIWGYTDLWTLIAYKELVDVFKFRNAPDLKEIVNGYNDYYSTIKNNFDRLSKQSEDLSEWVVPRDAMGLPEREEELKKQYISYAHAQAEWLKSGFAGYDTPIAKKILNTLTNNEVKSERGLYFPCSPVSSSGRIWYASYADEAVFAYYSVLNDRKQMKKIIDGQIKYSMSNEYYFCERFHDHDSYYVPWQPNASANGRIISMLFAYYGRKKYDINKNFVIS